MNDNTVRRYPPFGKGGAPATHIKNHPIEDVPSTQESTEGVRRYPPFGKGSAPVTASIKNHPIEES